MISFKAKYIGPATVQKLNTKNEFKDYKVSAVEFEQGSEADKRVLSSLHENWGFGDYYSRDIFYSYMAQSHFPNSHKYQRYIALTLQASDFDHPKSDDILGVMEITKGISDVNQITFIQIKPEYMKNNLNRIIKGVGTELLKVAEKLMPKGDIKLNAHNSAIEFYESNGYTLINNYKIMIKKR